MTYEMIAFLVTAVIILIGFIGHLFFEKTKIPSFLFLIFIGVLLGPVFHIIDRSSFIPLMEIFSTFTLIMVTFYSGLNLNIRDIIQQSARALIQSTIYILSSAFIIGIICNIILKWNFIEAFIFSSMTGGEVTAAVIVPLAFSLGLSNDVKSLLTLESAISTVITIVLFFMFLNQWLLGKTDIFAAASSIAGNFSIAIIYGSLLSLIFLRILYQYKDREYTYVLTIGLVLTLYVTVKWLGGNGELGVLIFGLFLSNHKVVSRLFNMHVDISLIFSRLNHFQDEISFLLETFFFVFLGLAFVIDEQYIFMGLLYGTIFLLILLLTRYTAVSIASRHSSLAKHRFIITVMCAQGIVPASLSIYLLRYGEMQLNTIFLSLITYIIILTNVVTTVGVLWFSRKRKSLYLKY